MSGSDELCAPSGNVFLFSGSAAMFVIGIEWRAGSNLFERSSGCSPILSES